MPRKSVPVALASPRLRTETRVLCDGGIDALLAADMFGRLAVLAISVAGDGSGVMVGQALTSGAAYDASFEALRSLTEPFRASAHERLMLGLVDGDPRDLAEAVRALGGPDPWTSGDRGDPTWGRARHDRRPGRPGGANRRAHRPDLDLRYGLLAPHMALRLCRFSTLPPAPPPATCEASGPAGLIRTMTPFLEDHAHISGVVAIGIGEFLKPWLSELSAVAQRNLEFLAPSTWNEATLAYYGVPGTLGTYRRQAGVLHPAFAVVIANEPAVSAAVDAGRPFELTLLQVLRGFLPSPLAVGLTMDRLRRMRGMAPESTMGRIAHLLAMAASFPPTCIPSTPAGWGMFTARAPKIEASARDLGLGLAGMLAPDTVPWPTGAGAVPEERVFAYLTQISFARDVADRCAETLVAPLLTGGRTHPAGRHLAARLLFGGMGILRISDLSYRWHKGLTAFEQSLPPPSPRATTWPALFAPFDAGDGLTVTCLTDPSSLREEGLEGRDADGRAGLAHCVGGFALSCYQGHAHIASVRRGRERLSTVSLQPADGRLFVLAHHGQRNADPPPEARKAIQRLVDAVLADRLHLDPEAVMERGAEGFDDGRVWSDPATRAAAFRAWSPYLRTALRRGGVEALAAHLSDLAQAAEGGTP